MTNLYKNLNFLKLKVERYLRTQTRKVYASTSLRNCTEIIQRLRYQISSVHSYSTRQKQNLVYFKPQIKKANRKELFAQRGFNLNGKKLNLPFNLAWFSFTAQYKKFLLKSYDLLKIKILSIANNDVTTLIITFFIQFLCLS